MTRYLFIADASDFPSDEEHEKGVIQTNLVYRVDYTSDPPELKLRDDLSGRVLSENFMDNSQVPGKSSFQSFLKLQYQHLSKCTNHFLQSSQPIALRLTDKRPITSRLR